MPLDKVVIVKKRTRLENLVDRYTTTSQVKFVLESRGESFDFYRLEDEVYKKGLRIVSELLPKTLRVQQLDKDLLSTFQFSDRDIVVVVGDDGLVVNTAKYIGTQPLISVNPDTERNDGVLASCTKYNFLQVLLDTLKGETDFERLTMAEARFDDDRVLYALNDFFIGAKGKAAARYEIEYDKEKEKHISDGVIVSTGTGSTGWIKSIFTGAYSLATGEPNIPEEVGVPFQRDSQYLMFAVMNPFTSKISGVGLTNGLLYRESPLKIKSQMPEKGVVFSDGIEDDYIKFTAGSVVSIQPAARKIQLVRPKKR